MGDVSMHNTTECWGIEFEPVLRAFAIQLRANSVVSACECIACCLDSCDGRGPYSRLVSLSQNSFGSFICGQYRCLQRNNLQCSRFTLMFWMAWTLSCSMPSFVARCMDQCQPALDGKRNRRLPDNSREH